MSLRTILISMIVAGVLAGLVMFSRGCGGGYETGGGLDQQYRHLGFDAASIVEIWVRGDEIGEQKAIRTVGTVDNWSLELDGDGAQQWKANAVRVRSVLRALASANVQVGGDEDLESVFGTLSLKGTDGRVVEVGFEHGAVGGFVRIEAVTRGDDGIATGRWFGLMKRTLRDSLLVEGLEDWRSMDLFDLTLSQVSWVEVWAEAVEGVERVELERTVQGWMVVEPWRERADTDSVGGMLGLTLGLSAERFFDESVYTDDLTGLDSPIARIGIRGRDSESVATIELGAAIDNSGKELFGRYTLVGGEGGQSVVVALKTKGLSRLIPSPLGYVHHAASVLSRVDIGEVKIVGGDGADRLVCQSRLGAWERDGVALTPSQGEAVDRLVRVLTNERASNIMVLKNGEESGATFVGEIALGTKEGRELERFGVGIESAGGTIRLHLLRAIDDETTLVWVCSSEQAAGTGAWVATLAAQGN